MSPLESSLALGLKTSVTSHMASFKSKEAIILINLPQKLNEFRNLELLEFVIHELQSITLEVWEVLEIIIAIERSPVKNSSVGCKRLLTKL